MVLSRRKINLSLRKLLERRSRSWTALRTLDKFEAEIESSTDDRGLVLITTAIVEQFLEEAILVHCTRKFDRDWRERLFGGAVQGFHGKILLGHALGLYNTAFYEDLDRIRAIRNVFAHARIPLKLHSKSLKEACNFHIFDPRITTFGKLTRWQGSPQRIFLGAAATLSLALDAISVTENWLSQKLDLIKTGFTPHRLHCLINLPSQILHVADEAVTTAQHPRTSPNHLFRNRGFLILLSTARFYGSPFV